MQIYKLNVNLASRLIVKVSCDKFPIQKKQDQHTFELFIKNFNL